MLKSLRVGYILPFALLSIDCFSQGPTYAPVSTGTYLVNDTYVVDFNAERNIPNWVYYVLTLKDVQGHVNSREYFLKDDRLESSPRHKDYTNSDFNRGHLKPAADSKNSQQDHDSSYLISNAVPQAPHMNQGVWLRLEEANRLWREQFDTLHIITGSSPISRDTITPAMIEVPDMLWKATLRLHPDTACIGFIIPNTNNFDDLESYRVSIDSIESLIGLDLFRQLSDDIETIVESDPSSVWRH